MACLKKRARHDNRCTIMKEIHFLMEMRYAYAFVSKLPRLRLASELHSRRSLDIVRSDRARQEERKPNPRFAFFFIYSILQ